MTTYFNELPLIQYDMEGDGNTRLVTNILIRVGIKRAVVNQASLFDQHDIMDFETPEMIAFKVYGDSNLYWVLLIINDIISPRYDWPMTQTVLTNYVNTKYSDLPNGIHHYEDANGFVVNSTEAGATAITNYIYEETLNETKRAIKILRPEFLSNFIDEYKTLVKRAL